MHECIVCGSKDTKRVIGMGFHPLADTFLKKEQLSQPQKLYPLNCLLCRNCGHLQNEYFVSGEERYVESNYSYTSSNSPSAISHWNEFCDTVAEFVDLKPKDVVIEFGSNDGYLLGKFQEKGARVIGIDPSPVMAGVANKNGIFTINDFLDKEVVDKAVEKYGKATIIQGNNVLNHIEYLNDAMKAIKSSILKEGYFIFEVPSLRDTVKKYLFDMIFHEHVSTFSIRSIDYLLKKHGLYIVKVEDIPYHGGSHRVYSSPDIKNYNKKLVDRIIAQENKAKLFDPKTYEKFMEKIIRDKNNVLAKIYSLKKKGKKIAAVGAGARSNTLLNFYRLDPTVIEFVTDASIHKQGKFIPESNIEIKDDRALKAEKIDVVLITAWNIGRYLVDKIRKDNPKMQFIVPGDKELM